MTRYGGWDAPGVRIERQLVLELITSAGSLDHWGIYEALHKTYHPDWEDDAGDSSADFCWLENLLHELEDAGLIVERDDGDYELTAWD